jgi:hypothetical protein
VSITHNEEFSEAISELKKRLIDEPITLDWAPTEINDILIGPLARVESEILTSRDGSSYDVHALVIDDHEDSTRKRLKIEGRSAKSWFAANRDLLKSGILLAVRFDGTRQGDRGEWREFLIRPDMRDGDEFTMPSSAGHESPGHAEPPF